MAGEWWGVNTLFSTENFIRSLLTKLGINNFQTMVDLVGSQDFQKKSGM